MFSLTVHESQNLFRKKRKKVVKAAKNSRTCKIKKAIKQLHNLKAKPIFFQRIVRLKT